MSNTGKSLSVRPPLREPHERYYEVFSQSGLVIKKFFAGKADIIEGKDTKRLVGGQE